MSTFGFEHFPVGPGLPVVLVYGEAAYRVSSARGLGLYRYSNVALPLCADGGDEGFVPLFRKLASRAVVIWPEAGAHGVARALAHARVIGACKALAVGVVAGEDAFDLGAFLPRDIEPSEIGARVDAALAEALARALPAQGVRRGRAIAPWLAPLDAGQMFARARAVFSSHLAEPSATLDTLVLWSLHAWCVRAGSGAFDVSPRLVLLGNDARADHARALRLLAWLTPSPLIVSRTVAAHLVRALEAERPTLLLDDVAGGMFYRRDMRTLIAAGATSDGLFLGAPTERNRNGRSPCFAPTAIATTSALPEDVRVRAIVVPMAPTPAGRTRPSLREVPDEVLELRAQMQAFAARTAVSLFDADAVMPRHFGIASRENWAPLIAVALAIGSRFGARTVAAAEALDRAEPAPVSNLALLADVRAGFGADGRTHVPSADMIMKLVADPERPWGRVHRGRRIDARDLAERLRSFGLRPVSLKTAGGEVVRGYRGDDLAEAYARYLNAPLVETGSGTVAAE